MTYSNYINEYSWKSFLGSGAKKITELGKFRHWETQKKRQLIKLGALEESDLIILKDLIPFSFFYFDKEEIKILEKLEEEGYEISYHKDPDIILPIEKLDYSGKSYRDIRWAINKCSKMGFEICDEFKKFEDIEIMIKKWGNSSAEKYFQDRSSKNKFLFKNNWHKDCLNTFIYDKENLIAFAVLSPPDENNSCSYIIGKSLCLLSNNNGQKYSGISEYADYLAYCKAQNAGAKLANLGGGAKGACLYKLKFPGAFKSDTWDGKIIKKEIK